MPDSVVKALLAFPALFDIAIQVVVLAVGVLMVSVLSKVLRLRPTPISIASTRKEGVLALLMIVALLAVRAVLDTVGSEFVLPSFPLYRLPPYSPFGAFDVAWYTAVSVMYLAPMMAAMRMSGQSLRSIGVNGKDKGRMLTLGFILSMIYIGVFGLFALFSGQVFTGLSASLGYGFVLFAVVGFTQEVVWRGYVQTRLIAHHGTIAGLVVTALFFGLWHFPMRYFQYSGAAFEALASCLLIFPAGLLNGYIMLKSQNILPSSIYHLFGNFSLLLWQAAAS